MSEAVRGILVFVAVLVLSIALGYGVALLQLKWGIIQKTRVWRFAQNRFGKVLSLFVGGVLFVGSLGAASLIFPKDFFSNAQYLIPSVFRGSLVPHNQSEMKPPSNPHGAKDSQEVASLVPIQQVVTTPSPKLKNPDIVKPAKIDTIRTESFTLQWTQVDKTKPYEVQISALPFQDERKFSLDTTVCTYSGIWMFDSVIKGDTKLQLYSHLKEDGRTIELNGGWYFWRVRTIEPASNLCSDWTYGYEFLIQIEDAEDAVAYSKFKFESPPKSIISMKKYTNQRVLITVPEESAFYIFNVSTLPPPTNYLSRKILPERPEWFHFDRFNVANPVVILSGTDNSAWELSVDELGESYPETDPRAKGIPQSNYSPYYVFLNGQYKLYWAYSPDGEIHIFNGITRDLIGILPIGTSPFGIAISPYYTQTKEQLVYVTVSGENALKVISTKNDSIIASIPLWGTPLGIDVSPEGDYIYIANKGGNNISVIRVTLSKAKDGNFKYLFVVEKTIQLEPATAPESLCFTQDGKQVWVTLCGRNQFAIIPVTN